MGFFAKRMRTSRAKQEASARRTIGRALPACDVRCVASDSSLRSPGLWVSLLPPDTAVENEVRVNRKVCAECHSLQHPPVIQFKNDFLESARTRRAFRFLAPSILDHHRSLRVSRCVDNDQRIGLEDRTCGISSTRFKVVTTAHHPKPQLPGSCPLPFSLMFSQLLLFDFLFIFESAPRCPP